VTTGGGVTGGGVTGGGVTGGGVTGGGVTGGDAGVAPLPHPTTVQTRNPAIAKPKNL